MKIITPLTPKPIEAGSEPPTINIAEVECMPLSLDDLTPGDAIYSDDGKMAVIRKVTASGVYVYIDGMREVIMECQLHHWFL